MPISNSFSFQAVCTNITQFWNSAVDAEKLSNFVLLLKNQFISRENGKLSKIPPLSIRKDGMLKKKPSLKHYELHSYAWKLPLPCWYQFIVIFHLRILDWEEGFQHQPLFSQFFCWKLLSSSLCKQKSPKNMTCQWHLNCEGF